MKNKFILIATHPRSGTHFIINALCMNFRDVEFPQIRNTYSTLEGLFLTHDKTYTKEWQQCLSEDNNKIKVFKTHLMPSEISRALDNEFYLNEKEKAIIKTIYEHSKIVNIYRDGRDVILSWYFYQKDAAGGLSTGTEIRIKECTFSEFIRMPNKYYMPIRGFEEKDKNRVEYWRAHVNEWLAKEDAVHLKYETLYNDFEATIRNLASSLGMQERLFDKIKRPEFVSAYSSDIFSRAKRKAKRTLRYLFNRNDSKRYKVVFPAHPRKGIIGDWKNYFNDSDLEFFMRFAKDVMIKLDYKI